MESCPFCRIVQGQGTARVLFSTDDVIAFHDIAPHAPVHVLVIPRRHVTSLALSTPEDRDLLGTLLLAAADAARRAGIADSGFRVVTNSGRGAGQTVPHLHFHVLGGRPLAWPPG